jgi:hypothetical protein
MILKDGILDILNNAEIFLHVPPAAVEELANEMNLKTYATDAAIIKKGETATF